MPCLLKDSSAVPGIERTTFASPVKRFYHSATTPLFAGHLTLCPSTIATGLISFIKITGLAGFNWVLG